YDFRAAQPAGEVLPDVMAALRQWVVHTTHPRYFGLFNPTPTWWGVAGDLLAAGVNAQLAAYSHAPAAVEVERHVLKFMAAALGLPGTTEGSFTVGGAEANLTAVVVALTRSFDSYADHGVAGLPGRPVFYASAESHLAWLKIAHLTGLGRRAVRLVPVDAAHRLDVERLRRLYDADRAEGMAPFLLVGTAGTTGGGALDPLPEMAGLAREWGLHFHVDAAWAGAVALSDRLRPLLAGVEQADSITIDAHKWLSVPMGAGMFLTRHAAALAESFRVNTAYMPDATEVADPYATSVQWSRRFTGLKVFIALAAVGQPGYAEQLERDVDLGELLARRLAENGWHRVNDTPLPVVCVVDPKADALDPGHSKRWHTAVADHVVRSGRAWISPVVLAGRPAIRLCLTSHRTRAQDIDEVVAALNSARSTTAVPTP
ncbi:MAG: pyridoxal phosphate-dependent decarboxylase family protein, partial [Micromonosporaceae bacterium]